MVKSRSTGTELKVLVKGYEQPRAVRPRNAGASDAGEALHEDETITPRQVAGDLFKVLRGSNNLIFPNRRSEVERYAHLLNILCEEARVPNEFWPHHGSLSKEIRSATEAALKRGDQPATAICTNTLELGLDIGAVKSVAQIGPSPSVAVFARGWGAPGGARVNPPFFAGTDRRCHNAGVHTFRAVALGYAADGSHDLAVAGGLV